MKLLGQGGLDIPFVVITDGDLTVRDGASVFLGLRRGMGLLKPTAQAQVTKLLDKEEWDDAKEKLASSGIFVGTRTLELDVAEMYPKQMIRAFEELPVSEKAVASFAKEMEQFAKEKKTVDISTAGEAIVRRIERIGKGRFSQRLANKLSGRAAPDYISNALEKIIEQIKETSA